MTFFTVLQHFAMANETWMSYSHTGLFSSLSIGWESLYNLYLHITDLPDAMILGLYIIKKASHRDMLLAISVFFHSRMRVCVCLCTHVRHICARLHVCACIWEEVHIYLCTHEWGGPMLMLGISFEHYLFIDEGHSLNLELAHSRWSS